MALCPACAHANRDGAKFCEECATPLAVAASARAHEERRLVTVLFADLAGFTSRSETLDPEDVRAFLLPYYDVLTTEITAHGGRVDRFLGDGIMAVFGAPVAHEDDAERAVRAALRILARIPTLRLDLHARIGINSGHVLFAAAAGGRDDSVTGDVVNTAARLQTLAPVDGVVVGEATRAATRDSFEYEAIPPALLKGKAEPVACFRPVGTRAGSAADAGHRVPYVGREADLALLRDVFDRSAGQSAVSLVTLVGEPGIGKSRTVAELRAYARATTTGLVWHRGRCIPYGDGVTFWALGEILKAHAGILETDDAVTATAKIDAAVPDGPDREWQRAHLLPLVGMDGPTGADRGELFAAWRTFLEGIAERSPTVLVFEDIHWADDAMLAFLEHLAKRAAGVPLLIVATTRPELFDRRPSFAAGLPNAHRVNLAPLSDAQTERLVSSLLGAVVPDALASQILERAAGNPLYAEEFVRLLRDRDLLVEAGGTVSLLTGVALPLPESIHALLAARLDTLPPRHRAMLADASVVGRVFWAGAVAAMGEIGGDEVDSAMGALARRELVRPVRHSSMEGESEHAFRHVVARDVAYAQLPRASRATRHEAAAIWLEGKAGERVEDLAEVLAHHWATALELARAAGQDDRVASLESRALHYLVLAGDKAANLDLATSVAAFERALALTPPGHGRRPEVLVRLASAGMDQGRLTESAALYEEAIAAFDAANRASEALAARVRLALCLINLGEADQPRRLLDIAIAGLEPAGPSEDLASALLYASWLLDGGPVAASLQDRSLSIAEDLDLTALRARAIGHRGLRRVHEGDRGGIDDMREALALGLASGVSRVPATLFGWLTLWVTLGEGHAAALALADDGLEFVRRRGMRLWEASIRDARSTALFAAGRWQELFDEAGTSRRSTADGAAPANMLHAAALSFSGHVEEAGAIALREIEGGQVYGGTWSAVVPAIRGLRAAGRADEATALLERSAERLAVGRKAPWFRLWLAREAADMGRDDIVRTCTAAPGLPWAVQTPAESASLNAIATEVDGRVADAAAAFWTAAAAWGAIEEPYEQAQALMGAARCLAALDRSAEAAGLRDEAAAILGRLAAIPVRAAAPAGMADPAAVTPTVGPGH